MFLTFFRVRLTRGNHICLTTEVLLVPDLMVIANKKKKG